MPSFPWSRAMTANQVDDRPLGNWQYRRVLSPSYIRVLQRATTTGVRTTIYSDSMTVVQRAPVQAGGTAGTTTTPPNTPVVEWIAARGDELIVSNAEVAAGTPTCDGICQLTRLSAQ